jgi:hypothetical protein
MVRQEKGAPIGQQVLLPALQLDMHAVFVARQLAMAHAHDLSKEPMGQAALARL